MASDRNQCRRELARILKHYAERAKRLQALLEEERAALASSDSVTLQEAVNAKEGCVLHMEQLESERRALCSRAGFDADETGMRALLDWCGAGTEIGDAWSELMACARRSEEMNRVNGAIGRVRHEQMLIALAVLNGADRPQTTYGARGQGSARFVQRPLARA